MQKFFKVGLASPQPVFSTGSLALTTGTYNNDFRVAYHISLNITKCFPKTVDFNDTSGQPMTFSPRQLCGVLLIYLVQLPIMQMHYHYVVRGKLMRIMKTLNLKEVYYYS